MKTLKHLIAVAFSTAALGLIISCSNNPKTEETNEDNKDSKELAEERNDAKFNKKPEDDAQFVVDAAEINLMEMNLGQLAETKGMMQDTRELGSMMNRDHKKAYEDLKSLAAKKTISVPEGMSDAAMSDYNNLKDKKGSDFDKEFCSKMVQGHKDAIVRFEKASREAVDADIQAWATNMLPSLRAHLDHAITCEEKVKEMK